MIELRERQTAQILKTTVLDVLASYGVSIQQIFSVTVDNGANMLAAVRKLKMDLDSMLLQQIEELRKLDAGNNDADEDTYGSMEGDADLTNDLSNAFQEQINLIRCAVHTLQLAINDVVNKSDESVKKITSVAKKCKAVKYTAFFEDNEATKPPDYSPTRWGGIYEMMDSFQSQKPFFEKLGQEFPELGKEYYLNIILTQMHCLIGFVFFFCYRVIFQ